MHYGPIKFKQKGKNVSKLIKIQQHLSVANVYDFAAAKGWIPYSSWQSRIEYFIHKKHEGRLSIPVDATFKDIQSRLHRVLEKIAELEGVKPTKINKEFLDYITDRPTILGDSSTHFPEHIELKHEAPLLLNDVPTGDFICKSEKLDYVQEAELSDLEDFKNTAHGRLSHLEEESSKVNEEVKKEEEHDSRDSKGRFAKGNKLGVKENLKGVRSIDVRQHRGFINSHVPELLEMLVEAALEKKDTQVAMWLVGKIVPDTKVATYSSGELLKSIENLTDLKDQSARAVEEAVTGEASLEETGMMLELCKSHKVMIEAADIEPLAQELSKKLGKVYGQS